MLNPFPELLSYALLGPFILRLILGIILIDLGFLKFRSERSGWIASFSALNLRPADLFVSLYAALQIIGGIMLLLGLWTQIAALAFVIFIGIELSLEFRDREILKRDLVFYTLMFTIALSLLFTGAGGYAIDIPL